MPFAARSRGEAPLPLTWKARAGSACKGRTRCCATGQSGVMARTRFDDGFGTRAQPYEPSISDRSDCSLRRALSGAQRPCHQSCDLSSHRPIAHRRRRQLHQHTSTEHGGRTIGNFPEINAEPARRAGAVHACCAAMSRRWAPRRRTGPSTNSAAATTTKFIAAATMKTACHPPV